MTRQHLRALFSDSSSSVGSTRACLAASKLDRRSCGSITSLKQGPSGRQSRRSFRNIAPVQQSPSGKLHPESLSSSFLVCKPRSIGQIPCQKAAQEPKLASKAELRCVVSFQKNCAHIEHQLFPQTAPRHVGASSKSLIPRTKVRDSRTIFPKRRGGAIPARGGARLLGGSGAGEHSSCFK